MYKDWLRGKTIVVTGAGNGLGKYLVYDLIKQYSCEVIGIDLDEIAMSNLKTNLGEDGKNFKYFSFDAKVEANWTKFSSELVNNQFDVDVLINAIGQSPKFGGFETYTHKDTSNTFANNLYSCIFAIKSLFQKIKKSRTPAIINICCSSATLAIAGTSIYSASKSALKCYTEVLQQELKDVYVGLFTLGLINTNFWNKQDEVIKNKLNNRGMSPQKASEKVIKCILRKKKRAIIGIGAHFADRLVRLMPYKAQTWINNYAKKHKYRFLNE